MELDGGEMTHSLFHSHPFHQSEELPPLVGAVKEQRHTPRGAKETVGSWCEFVTKLHGLSERKDDLSVVFFPSLVCKACGERLVNRTKLRDRGCQRKLVIAAQLALVPEKRQAGRWPDE